MIVFIRAILLYLLIIFCLRLMGPMYIVRNRTYSGMTVSPYSISVNLLGKRYASEPLIAHMDQFDGGAVVGQQGLPPLAAEGDLLLKPAVQHSELGFHHAMTSTSPRPTKSTWSAASFLPPNMVLAPTAMWKVPAIFSSSRG